MCNCCFKSHEMNFKHDFLRERNLFLRKSVLSCQKFKKYLIALFHVSGYSGHFLKIFIFLGHLNLYSFFRGWGMTGGNDRNYE